jgi:hypothetical protein
MRDGADGVITGLTRSRRGDISAGMTTSRNCLALEMERCP